MKRTILASDEGIAAPPPKTPPKMIAIATVARMAIPVMKVTIDQRCRPRVTAASRLPWASSMTIEFPATEEKLRSLSAKYVGTALSTNHSPYTGTPHALRKTGTLTTWIASVTPTPPMFAASPRTIRPAAPATSRPGPVGSSRGTGSASVTSELRAAIRTSQSLHGVLPPTASELRTQTARGRGPCPMIVVAARRACWHPTESRP